MWGLKEVSVRRSDALTQVSWPQLESLLAEHFRTEGYQVEHCGTGRSGSRFDGGIDLKLRRSGEYVLVQVKQNEGASGAILVTSGEFTQAALDAANRQGHVRLIDGAELRSMLDPEAVGALQPIADRASDFVGAINGLVPERLAPAVRSYGAGRENAARGWVIVSAVCLVIFVLLIRGVLKKTEGTAGRSERSSVATPISSDISAEEDPASPVDVEPRSSAAGDACKEVVDHFSGTYIDHCASGPRPARSTDAEIREQQRRADEAARVIEATTPEM